MPFEDTDTPTTEEAVEDQAQISQEETNPQETDNPSNKPSANDGENAKGGVEFTSEQQAKINELVTARLERQMNGLLKRYGVKDKEEFDSLVSKSQSYSVMKERYEERGKELDVLNEKLAFIQNNINPNRYDDIRAYFKGKGIAFNDDSLKQELTTHPEWLNVVKQDTTPKTTIQTLGTDHEAKNVGETEEQRMNRVFGLN